MVGARAEFLGAGHYLPLANVLVELSKNYAVEARLIVEGGAGTGYYIASVLDALPRSLGLAIDLSKYAARRAAKAHGRLNAAVADIWERLPLKDGSTRALSVGNRRRRPSRRPKQRHSASGHPRRRWKYVPGAAGGAARGGSYGTSPEIQLYNLSNDLAEENNLAEKQPAKVKEFQALLGKIKTDGRSAP